MSPPPLGVLCTPPAPSASLRPAPSSLPTRHPQHQAPALAGAKLLMGAHWSTSSRRTEQAPASGGKVRTPGSRKRSACHGLSGSRRPQAATWTWPARRPPLRGAKTPTNRAQPASRLAAQRGACGRHGLSRRCKSTATEYRLSGRRRLPPLPWPTDGPWKAADARLRAAEGCGHPGPARASCSNGVFRPDRAAGAGQDQAAGADPGQGPGQPRRRAAASAARAFRRALHLINLLIKYLLRNYSMKLLY